MKTPEIVVSRGGGVLLGPSVVCDGFLQSAPIRVQTHVHDDHMGGFNSSKGFQTIIASEATKALLIADLNSELSLRSNFRSMPVLRQAEIEGVNIELLPSEHMLGAVQVVVTLADGTRVAYSGDFNWPLAHVPAVDVLVVDSTYGAPESTRAYTRGDVEARLTELVLRKLNDGPVHLNAHRGTVERALEILDAARIKPIVASHRLCNEIAVYQRFGYSIGPVHELDSDQAQHALRDGRYVRLYSKGDGSVFGITAGTAITLSAYMTPQDDPVLEYNEHAYRVALSGHADFNETLEYVGATGAGFVITDNSRGGHAIELATAIRTRLGKEAHPSDQVLTRLWGR